MCCGEAEVGEAGEDNGGTSSKELDSYEVGAIED